MVSTAENRLTPQPINAIKELSQGEKRVCQLSQPVLSCFPELKEVIDETIWRRETRGDRHPRENLTMPDMQLYPFLAS